MTRNMRSTISVVIVAGACGIPAGTPLVILGTIGRAAKDGAIIKGGLYLEKLAEVHSLKTKGQFSGYPYGHLRRPAKKSRLSGPSTRLDRAEAFGLSDC